MSPGFCRSESQEWPGQRFRLLLCREAADVHWDFTRPRAGRGGRRSRAGPLAWLGRSLIRLHVGLSANLGLPPLMASGLQRWTS